MYNNKMKAFIIVRFEHILQQHFATLFHATQHICLKSYCDLLVHFQHTKYFFNFLARSNHIINIKATHYWAATKNLRNPVLHVDVRDHPYITAHYFMISRHLPSLMLHCHKTLPCPATSHCDTYPII